MKDIKKKFNRRDFLRSTSLVAVVITLPGFISCNNKEVDDPNVEPCKTTDDILGPFYKSNAPFRENIIPLENTSESLIVKGKVFTGCDTALTEALVEIWNANDVGVYDNSNTYNFRGSYKTEQDGFYKFNTIIPGAYLNGDTYRPSHIHFRITAQNHQELVSQIYFKDDPFIKNDPWAGDKKASERILLIEKDKNGVDTVIFNIHMNTL